MSFLPDLSPKHPHMRGADGVGRFRPWDGQIRNTPTYVGQTIGMGVWGLVSTMKHPHICGENVGKYL